jgi:tripartite motif-containing protein 71
MSSNDSEQNLEHFTEKEMLDLRLISEDVLIHAIVPFIDTKTLHYLKCTNSDWKGKAEQHIINSAPKFKFKIKFGSRGNANGQFNHHCFVTTDEKGNIYVSDSANHRIQKFDSNGQWKQSIGSYGFVEGQFVGTMGIGFNSKNHLMVVDYCNSRIQVFNQNLQFIKTFGLEGSENGQFRLPSGIAVDADDNILVVDYCNRRVQIFDEDGNWKKSIGKEDGNFIYPCDIAISKKDARIFVTDIYNHLIRVFSSEGKFLFQFCSNNSENEQSNHLFMVSLTNCGQYLLVCDSCNCAIQVFNAMNGAFMKSYGSKGSGDGQFECPSGICISPSGQIIVSESGNHRIQIFE